MLFWQCTNASIKYVDFWGIIITILSVMVCRPSSILCASSWPTCKHVLQLYIFYSWYYCYSCNPILKTFMLPLLLHVHWSHGHSAQDYFCEYLHMYGSPLHSEIKLGYLSNDSDWLQVGQTWFLFPGSSRSCYIVSQLVKTGSGTDTASCLVVPELIVPGVKSSFSAKVMNLWSFILILTHAYMAWCLDTGTMFTAVLTVKFWFYDL